MRTILLICLLSLTAFSTTLNAQSAKRETQGTRWWYGAHVNLGFSASQFQSFLSVGVSPMMGYKVTPALSVGPRAKIIYNNYRVRDGFGNAIGKGILDLGLGAFTRVNVYQGFFAQGEFGYESNGYPRTNGVDIFVDRLNGLNAYVGAGFNSGAGNGSRIAYEVMLAYDLNLLRANTLALLNYRFGFTIFY